MRDHNMEKPAIGWTGILTTLKYIKIVLPVLQWQQREIDFTFIVIADINPELPLKDYEFIKWQSDTEINDLLNIHIGLMSLYDGDFEKGNCGFKAIQYMSLGIPVLVSPVG